MKNQIKDKAYMKQLSAAKNFLIEHDNDNKLVFLISGLKTSKKLHSQKYEDIYEYISFHYPDNLNIVAGLCYLTEENEET